MKRPKVGAVYIAATDLRGAKRVEYRVVGGVEMKIVPLYGDSVVETGTPVRVQRVVGTQGRKLAHVETIAPPHREVMVHWNELAEE